MSGLGTDLLVLLKEGLTDLQWRGSVEGPPVHSGRQVSRVQEYDGLSIIIILKTTDFTIMDIDMEEKRTGIVETNDLDLDLCWSL